MNSSVKFWPWNWTHFEKLLKPVIIRVIRHCGAAWVMKENDIEMHGYKSHIENCIAGKTCFFITKEEGILIKRRSGAPEI